MLITIFNQCVHTTNATNTTNALISQKEVIGYVRGVIEATDGRRFNTRKDRSRRNWATISAFVRMRPYALFWHAYAGEKL